MASDSDLYQNLISTDFENTTAFAINACSPNLVMATSVNTSILSSFSRCLPFFITHTAPSSKPTNPSTIDQSKCESESESESDSIARKFDDEYERTKLVNMMKAGFQLLFSEVDDKSQYTSLGIKVILEIDHEQIQEELEDSAKATPCDASPTYKLEAEDAIGLILDYAGFWIYSCSSVLTDELVTSSDEKTSFLNLCGRNTEESNQSSSGYAEVVFFALVEGLIDDKLISDSEQLKKFLKDLSEKKMGIWSKVHATCSSVAEN
ncbi:uncharacterized protein LOC110711025 [Chenopodium quinoa]|uniref:uncharacterized protein LOC110711025 n=1 Tax=Chenopodium quinoa TaxID=63459 RepID=UPI000B7941CD|nr:uncharacterized protein LOC110711025 [Chenopodium quinoa]